MTLLLQNTILIALYYVAGQGAWLLAIPPYYASFFWPSAGIALAFTYLYGYRVLLGIFLGAGILSFFSPLVEEITIQNYLTAFGLGFGAALQAFIAVCILRHFLAPKTRFHSFQSIMLFSVISALSCITSATIAFISFYSVSLISLSDFFGFWIPWVTGDILGVLVTAPLLILLFNKDAVSKKRKAIILGSILFLFSFILVIFEHIQQKSLKIKQKAFQHHVEQIMHDIQVELDIYQHDMATILSFYNASDYVERDEFDRFVSEILMRNNGVYAIGWAPYVLQQDLDLFLYQARQTYDENYIINMQGAQNSLIPTNQKEYYLPLYYIASKKTGKEALGFDLMSNAVRKKTIENARNTGALSASEPVTLVGFDQQERSGFLLVNALYANDKEKSFKGVLVGAFHYDHIIERVMSSWEDQGIAVSLKVSSQNGLKTVLHGSQEQNLEKYIEGFVADIPIKFVNQEWFFSFRLNPEFYYQNMTYTVWYILVAALFCLYFLKTCLLTLTGQAELMKEAITEKTKEISYKNKFLNIIMDSVPDMIFVKDKNFNIVQANQSFFDKYDPDKRDHIIGHSGLEQFPEEEQKIYLENDRKALLEGFSEVEETITDYRGNIRTLLTRKVRFYDDNKEAFLLAYSRDITDFLSAQRKLETILDTTADGLITIRENGIVETYNKACESIFGYKAEEIIGKNINLLMPEKQARDHGAYLDRYLKTGEKQILGQSREVIAKHKDSSLIPIDLSVAEVQLSGRRIFSGVLRDITQRKKAEELSQQIAQIFNNATIEFYIIDAETFELLLVNDSATRNMGYSQEALTSIKPSEFSTTYDDAFFTKIKETLLSDDKERFDYETRHIRKDDSEYDALASIQLTQFDGRPAFMASIIDVTERNKVLAELKRSNKELESFAYVTSHDLKAPLRHISMSAGFFKEKFAEQLDDKSRELLDVMLDGTMRMQNMIESLLAYSRVGRDNLDFTRINLNDAVLAARQNLASEIFTKSAIIHSDLLPTIKADRYLIIQLFQNLIQNAIKYQKENIPPEIKISSTKSSDHIQISVADNGIGVDPAYADKIFQIFQRLHRDNEYEGVGIGLSICQRIVEFHGGWITLDKNYTDGTKIIFTLSRNKNN